ncbi:hypothetical protein VE00_06272 [Pseudogymnoascus sp. WSF 3629]|nr:hypothetical protein VE00_06272 [Pseudogymnoascus sp. WSF 3629]
MSDKGAILLYGVFPFPCCGRHIDLEPTSSRQPGLASLRNYIDELGSFAGLDDPPGNYEDMLHDAADNQADITGEPVKLTLDYLMRNQRKFIATMRKQYVGPAGHPAMHNLGEPTNLTADLMDEQQHAFNSHLSTYGVGSSVSTSINGRMSDVGSDIYQLKRRFYVLKNCPVPMVIGMKFLREAEILTRHRHLLESCPAEMSNISSLLWIGSPRNRLRCTVDGRQLVATADTGSDLNLMSLACAEREGFRIDKRIEARTQIAVGNGKVIDTLGQVYVSNLTLDWREPEAEPPEQSPRGPANDVPLEPDSQGGAYPPQGGDDDLYIAFHVIENLPCDVVFGQKFLYDTDAFNKCPELLDIPPTKQNRQFEKHKQQYEFMIFVNNIFPRLGFSKKPKLAVDIKEQHERNWHAERYRRSNNTEEKIALLSLDKQEAARRAEKKSIQDWKSKHGDCRFCGTRSAT